VTLAAGARRSLWKLLRRLPRCEIRVRTRHGTFGVSNKDAGVGRRLFIDREFEWGIVDKAMSLGMASRRLSARNPTLLLDVGANIGTVCVRLVRDGTFAGAIAIEPEAGNHALLARNVDRNGLGRVIRTSNCALSSSNGTLALELSSNSGDHRIRMDGPLPPPRYREARRPLVAVPVYRLDDFVDTVPVAPSDLGLIWMDVQGHETHVLDGARKVLDAGMPVVAEFWPYGLGRAGVSPEQFMKTIGDLFDRFYDLGEEAPVARPAADIGLLFERHQHFKSFTDLLLIRT
jgi:FkbM family methyltransferase